MNVGILGDDVPLQSLDQILVVTIGIELFLTLLLVTFGATATRRSRT